MIEVQLRQHLLQQEALSPFLATYAGDMAIFNQEAPADNDSGWGDGSQYGRIVFYIDMQDDPQRNISGTMGVDIYCESGTEQVPEAIEPILRSLIDGYFFSNESVTIAAQWRSTQYSTEPTKNVVGATLVFNLLDFPTQQTTDPDPIALFNDWTEHDLPEIIGVKRIRVIGKDKLPVAWKPSNDYPALYWRIGEIRNCVWIPETYQCTWETAVIWGHIMASDSAAATRIARLIQNTLITKRRLIFDDMAPLMIDRNINVTPANDPLRIGLINLEGTYGILNPKPPTLPLAYITVERKENSNGNISKS